MKFHSRKVRFCSRQNGSPKQAQYHSDSRYRALWNRPTALRFNLPGTAGTSGIILQIEDAIGRCQVNSGRKIAGTQKHSMMTVEGDGMTEVVQDK